MFLVKSLYCATLAKISIQTFLSDKLISQLLQDETLIVHFLVSTGEESLDILWTASLLPSFSNHNDHQKKRPLHEQHRGAFSGG